jgi:hypothetical protein
MDLEEITELIDCRAKLVSTLRNLTKELSEADPRSIKFLELLIVQKYLSSKLKIEFDLTSLIGNINEDIKSFNIIERDDIQKDIDYLHFLKSENSLDTILNSVTLLKEDQWDENP